MCKDYGRVDAVPVEVVTTTLCKYVWGLAPEGPIPEHPVHASRSGLDSYESNGGPLGGIECPIMHGL